MFFKIFWQIAVLYTICAQSCDPWTDQEALKQLWLNLSTQECGHPSLLMVPGFSDLSVHKGESIDRFVCDGTEAICSPTDQLCAICKRGSMDNVTKDFCDDSALPEGHHPIEVSSDCQWYYQSSMNKFRYPQIVNEAFCSCSYCKTHKGNSDFRCEGVYHRIPILLAINRDESGPCEYDLKYQNLRVGCSCSRTPGHSKEGKQSDKKDNTPLIARENEEEIAEKGSRKGCLKSYRKCQRENRDVQDCHNQKNACLTSVNH